MPPGALLGLCGLDEEGRLLLADGAKSRACCDVRFGPRGASECWKGVYQYSTCCVEPPRLHEPVPGEEEPCDVLFQEALQDFDELRQYIEAQAHSDVRGMPEEYERAFLEYICCSGLIPNDVLRRHCWSDLETLWPGAFTNDLAPPGFESHLEGFAFSRKQARCCRGGLWRRLHGAPDLVLRQRLEDHLRSALRFDDDPAERAAALARLREGSLQDGMMPHRTQRLLQPLLNGACCCRLRVSGGRLLPIECPVSRDGSIHGYAASFALTYYRALLVAEALGAPALADMDALLHWGDFSLDDRGFPIFAQAANFHTKNVLLLPDHKSLGTDLPFLRRGYFEVEASAYPWDLKESVLLWRGSPSAPTEPYCAAWLDAKAEIFRAADGNRMWMDWELEGLPSCGASAEHPDFGRQRVVRLSHRLLDAQFSRGSESKSAEATSRDFARSKWLLSLDGFANDFRVTWIPLTGSLLIRQQSPVRDWFAVAGLEAGRHFVYVAANLSDVPEVALWLESHDAEAREVAERGKRFIEERASYDGAVEFLYGLFQTYARVMSTSN